MSVLIRISENEKGDERMAGKDFVLKLMSCVIIIAALFYYNQVMKLNGELIAANNQLEEIAAQTVAAEQTETAGEEDSAEQSNADTGGQYEDGTYSGTAQGYGGPVVTQITITNGYISGIEVTSAEGEDAAYYNMALDVLDKIAASQSADVDTVSGATYTSKGIINGAQEALEKAKKL